MRNDPHAVLLAEADSGVAAQPLDVSTLLTYPRRAFPLQGRERVGRSGCRVRGYDVKWTSAGFFTGAKETLSQEDKRSHVEFYEKLHQGFLPV